MRITDANGNKIIVGMDELQATNFQTNGTNTWSREFSYSSDTGLTVGIKQIVSVVDTSADEKNYIISYEFTKSADVADLEFMFHVDTAYNNNDRCEGYYVGGNRVNQYCVYNKDAAASDLIGANNSSYVQNGSMPSSFSIVDVDNALAFSEKISFASGEEPDSLSIGHYNAIDEWSYYNSLDRNLGQNTKRRDLGFSLYYDLNDLTTRNAVSFNYGIVSTSADANLADVTLNEDTRAAIDHSGKKSVWIQSGAEATSGLWLEIDEMNTDVLGLRGVDVSTQRGAGDAISRIKGALQKVSTNRSVIGAQQNRMEHIIANEENIVENTTAAESRIRDTDMSTEMVRLSNLNILTQAGEILLAQANQSKQGVMSLLG